MQCSRRAVRCSSLDLRLDSVNIPLLTKGTLDIDLGRDYEKIFALRKMKLAYTTQQQVVNPPKGRCSRMSPTEPSREELTWSWARSTGHQASDQIVEAAAKAAWPYAVLCAWIYLNDQDSAHELMEHAVSNASQYITRHQDTSTDKLTARIRSALKRRAQQIVAMTCPHFPHGNLT